MKNRANSVIRYVKKYLFSFIQAQLVVSIVSIPILVGWGLPMSLMTFFGNLIFAPVLIIFLVLSSLIFFMQLLHIPNGILIEFLKITTATWINFLKLGTKHWLWGFCRPHSFVLISIPILSFGTLYLFRFKSVKFKMIVMACLFLITILGLTIFPYLNHHHTKKILSGGKLVIEIDENFKVKVTDNGYFNKYKSPCNLINYDVKQFLIKNTGQPKIDSLVLLRPGYRTFKTGQECCNLLNVKSITMSFFDGSKFKKHVWREFFKLKRISVEQKIPITRIKKEKRYYLEMSQE